MGAVDSTLRSFTPSQSNYNQDAVIIRVSKQQQGSGDASFLGSLQAKASSSYKLFARLLIRVASLQISDPAVEKIRQEMNVVALQDARVDPAPIDQVSLASAISSRRARDSVMSLLS